MWCFASSSFKLSRHEMKLLYSSRSYQYSSLVFFPFFEFLVLLDALKARDRSEAVLGFFGFMRCLSTHLRRRLSIYTSYLSFDSGWILYTYVHINCRATLAADSVWILSFFSRQLVEKQRPALFYIIKRKVADCIQLLTWLANASVLHQHGNFKFPASFDFT